MKNYINIANYFKINYKDYNICAYFFMKCINYSQEYDIQEYHALGKIGLADCYVKLGKPEESIKILEESLIITSNEDTKNEIWQNLVEIYKKIAENMEKASTRDPNLIKYALSNYHKCLQACNNINNLEKEGEISHRIGNIYLKINEYEKSIEFQKIYMSKITKIVNDQSKNKEMKAHASLAQCYLKINDIDSAYKHLEQYYEFAKNAKEKTLNSLALADSAHHLANLYWKINNPDDAIKFYKTFFQSAKEEKERKNRKLVDKARICLGLSQGTIKLNDFFNKILESKKKIKQIITYKNKKD